MADSASEITHNIDRILSGGYSSVDVKCPKCGTAFFISNHTTRDEVLNHMIGHFFEIPAIVTEGGYVPGLESPTDKVR